MKKSSFLLCTFIIGIFVVACNRALRFDVHTYYCKGRDITFKYLEKDTFDVLVFDDSDSIYIGKNFRGYYTGIQFHIPEDSDIIYFEDGAFQDIYRYVENKYKIKLLKFGIYGKEEHRYLIDFDEKDLQEYFDALDNHHAWGFYGGGWEFAVFHDSLYLGSLYPLE